jgi:hypothetical protein
MLIIFKLKFKDYLSPKHCGSYKFTYDLQCPNILLLVYVIVSKMHGINNIKFQFYIHVLNIKYNIEHNNQLLCYIVCYRIIYCSTIKVVLGNTTRN